MNIQFTTSVRDLADMGIISPRSHNTCIANGIENVKDLDHYHHSEKGFLGFRNCGNKTNSELKEVLRLAHDPEKTEECASSFIRALPGDVVFAFRNGIEEVISEPGRNGAVKLFNSLFTPDLFTYLCYRDREYVLDMADSTDVENDDVARYALRKMMFDIVCNVLERLTGNFDASVRRERASLRKLRPALEHRLHTDHVAGYYAALLSGKKMRLAQLEYNRLVENAPRIVHNFIRKHSLDLESSWQLLNLDEDEFFKRYPTCRKGAVGYIHLLADFKRYVEGLVNSSEEEDVKEELKIKFPFLTDAEAIEAVKFRIGHEHLPMLFITDSYFRHTDFRQHRIYARCFGLGGMEARRKTEVADELGVSRERVRQIISDTDFSRCSFAEPSLWEAYGINESDFITPLSKEWKHLMYVEGLQPVFTAYAGIMVGVHGFIYKRMAGVDKFLARPGYADRYSRYLKHMLDLRDRTHVEDKLVDISDILEEADRTDSKVRDTVLREIATYLAVDTLGTKLFFPHNSVDVAAEVETMLQKEGNPLHIDEILDRMNLMFPDLGLTKDRLKFQMRSSDEIVPKGKTSLYCMRSWTHVFIGSIRDLVKQILSDSDIPVSMDTIMQVVSENFDTTRYNVYNSLLICDDFVQYEGSRFGLAHKTYGPEFIVSERSSSRKSFRERFDDYKSFVEKNGHHPFNSGDDDEETLKRWQVNVLKQLITVTPEEKEELQEYLRSHDQIPFSSLEYSFKQSCDAYLDFVRNYGVSPTPKSDPELVKWYRKQLSRYEDYTDLRKEYFESMLETIRAEEKSLF